MLFNRVISSGIWSEIKSGRISQLTDVVLAACTEGKRLLVHEIKRTHDILNKIKQKYYNKTSRTCLDLVLGKTVLPEDEVGGDTILTVVEESDHSIGVHGLTGEELVVLEVGNNLLDVGSGTLLESGNSVGVLLSKLSLDSLHVALDVGNKGLLVERGLLETKRVDNVVDGDGTLLNIVAGLLSRGVGTNVNVSTRLDGDVGRVNLVDGVVNDIEVVGVRKHLVARNEILENKHFEDVVCWLFLLKVRQVLREKRERGKGNFLIFQPRRKFF